ECEQLREAKTAVAAGARIRRLAAGVTADKRSHDCPAKFVAEVECHVRTAERVAGLARGDHGLRRAARALRVRRGGIDPEPQRDADPPPPRAPAPHWPDDT